MIDYHRRRLVERDMTLRVHRRPVECDGQLDQELAQLSGQRDALGSDRTALQPARQAVRVWESRLWKGADGAATRQATVICGIS